jgi:hypothetical protein
MGARKRLRPTKDKHDGHDSKGRFTRGHKAYTTPGRPRAAMGFRDNCRNWMNDDGFAKLVAIASNDKHRHQLDAIELLAAYGFGRPQVGVTVEHIQAPIINVIYPEEKKMVDVTPSKRNLLDALSNFGSSIGE